MLRLKWRRGPGRPSALRLPKEARDLGRQGGCAYIWAQTSPTTSSSLGDELRIRGGLCRCCLAAHHHKLTSGQGWPQQRQWCTAPWKRGRKRPRLAPQTVLHSPLAAPGCQRCCFRMEAESPRSRRSTASHPSRHYRSPTFVPSPFDASPVWWCFLVSIRITATIITPTRLPPQQYALVWMFAVRVQWLWRWATGVGAGLWLFRPWFVWLMCCPICLSFTRLWWWCRCQPQFELDL